MAIPALLSDERLGEWKKVIPSMYLHPYGSLNAIYPVKGANTVGPLKYWWSIDDEPTTSIGKGIWFGEPLEPISTPAHGARTSSFTDREKRIADLELKNSELCRFAAQCPPHKQFLRIALAFLLFFSAILTSQLFVGIWLIAPALAWVGIAVSSSTVLLSYLASLDWQDWRSARARASLQ